MTRPRILSRFAGASAVAAVAGALALAVPLSASAAGYPSDTTAPDVIPLLQGYRDYWTPSGANDLHGTVVNADVLSRDDQLTVWINQNATPAARTLALQDAEYQNSTNTAFDQSVTVGTGLGSKLGQYYIEGRNSGALPLTSALINSTNGSSGAYVGTGAAKAAYSHPRPYLPSDPATAPVSGDAAGCSPTTVNASSQQAIRTGKAWAAANGNLLITRVPDITDTSHRFSPNDVPLSAGYGTTGICTGGSFPSGHTTTAYQAGITLATLLPELAPEVLARASEAGNSRIVLGVHYPLDIMGGRIDGEAALAARWSDAQYRTGVLEPARAELLTYLQTRCGAALAACIASQTPYASNPYNGQAMPGGTSQIVTDRASAVAVYRERMTYGFPQVTAAGRAASVPAGASNLLLTTFPTLTDAQRTAVLAQTEVDSGYPLDQTGTAAGSWQRLDLAAAMSATVQLAADGSVQVLRVGGAAQVLPAAAGSAPAASDPELAATGPVDPTAPLLIAGGLLAAGTATLLVARRRRARS